MRTACRLVQAIYRVTSFPLSVCACKQTWAIEGLCSLHRKQIVSLVKANLRFGVPNFFLHSKETLTNVFRLDWKEFILLCKAWVSALLVVNDSTIKNDRNSIFKTKILFYIISVFESFILDYIKRFTIGQQQKYTADCVVLVQYCEKQFCVR